MFFICPHFFCLLSCWATFSFKGYFDNQLWFLKLQEKFEMELKKHTDEAACKVAVVLQRAEEQVQMIESLHTSVSFVRPSSLGLVLILP